MAILDIFRSSPTPKPDAAAATAATVAANPTVPSSNTPASSGAVPAIPATATGDQSPTSKFDDLFKTPDTSPAPVQLLPTMNLDIGQLRSAAEKVDFTAHIPKELATKALSGDVDAFMSVINKATQLGFANATATSGELVKQSFNNAQGTLQEKLIPQAIRQADISQAMLAENPIFSQPSVAPMLGLLQNSLSSKYPTASPQEIAAMAKEYLTGVSQQIVTSSGSQIVTQQQAASSMSRAPTDWEKYFA